MPGDQTTRPENLSISAENRGAGRAAASKGRDARADFGDTRCMPAAQAPSRVGEVIGGKYQLAERLAVGGMGEVYRAMNLSASRPCALKLLRRELCDNEAHVRRFMREGRAANKARHPNILEVIDVDRDEDGNLYLVQELLEGEDLGRRLARRGRKLPLDEAFDVLIPVARAIGAAHAVGLVHRDLKPSNVFLSTSPGGVETPKVLDFGIAKVVQDDPEGNTALTATDIALGTPGYMSPEQVKTPKTVDARSDVWSLGVLIYRTVAGKLPFLASSPGALMVAICTEPHTPITQYLPHLPEALVALVDCCLEKDPRRRFADGDALARALVSVAEEHAETISAARARGGADAQAFAEANTIADTGGSLPSPDEWELEAPPSSQTPAAARGTGTLASRTEADWALTPTDAPLVSERRPVLRPQPTPVGMPAATSISTTRLRDATVADGEIAPAASEDPGLSMIVAGAVVGTIALGFSWTVARPGAFVELRETLGSLGVGFLAVVFAGAAWVGWQRAEDISGRIAAAGLAAVSACAAVAGWSLGWGTIEFELVQRLTPWAVFAATAGLALAAGLRAKALLEEHTGVALALIALSLLGCYAALQLAL